MTIYETERLIVREMTKADLPPLAVMLQDPLCMSAYEGVFSNAETQAWLHRQIERYREHGFGLWAIVLKSTDEMIGQCGLSWQEFNGHHVREIGYLLQRQHWHKGYAIEAACGCKQYAFEKLMSDEVFSMVRDTNIASMNVAIRNGMTIRGCFVKHYRNVDMLHYAFSVKIPTPDVSKANPREIIDTPLEPTDAESVEAIDEEEFKMVQEHHGGVDKFSPPAEKIALFISLFRGRSDVYALRRYSKRFGNAYYMPACRNEYRPNVCGKPKQKCGTCKKRDFIPFDADVIRAHLTNTDENGNGIIGVYPLLPDDTCRFLAMDFDGAEWTKDVASLRTICEENDISCAVERSRSGDGAHVWFFFDKPLPASHARRFGSLLITKAMNSRHEIRFPSYDRMFPNQDSVPKGGFGNLIALPLQGGPRMKGNSVFIDGDLKPYPDQWAFLAAVERIDSARSDWLTKVLDVDGELGSLVACPESNDEKPWEAPRRPPHLLKKDFPKSLRCIEANTLFVEKEGLSQRAMNRIKRLAAFPNPGFYLKQRMRMSTFGVPRIVYAADETPTWISIPRGCRSALESLAEGAGIPLVFEDKREIGRPLEIRFTGELRMDQVFAVDALASEDNGVMAAATGFGKTVAAAALIAKLQRSTLILVHTHTLLAQWRKALTRFLKNTHDGVDLNIGEYSGGKKSLTGGIDVMTVQSLPTDTMTECDITRGYGVIIVDECHHVPALTIEKALGTMNARRVYGLTATPARKDGLQPLIFMQCGPIRYRASSKDQAAHGVNRLVMPRITRFKKPFNIDEEEWTFAKIYGDIVEDEERNALIIADAVQALKEGRSPLLLSQRTDHVRVLAGMLRKGTDAKVFELIGSETAKTKREKEKELAEVGDAEAMAIVATGQYVGEGFDMPRLDTLLLAMPVSWKGLVEQYAGRLHREHAGKRNVLIYDYVDVHVGVLERMYQRRLKAYAQIGYCTAAAEGEITGGNVIYGTRSFMPVMKQDFECAKADILIVSPFIRKRRTENILDWLKPAQAKGVIVHIVTRPSESYRSDAGAVIADCIIQLRNAGIVVIERTAIHQKFVLIDRRLVWYGSLNLLSFGSSEESLMRLASREVATELQKTILPDTRQPL